MNDPEGEDGSGPTRLAEIRLAALGTKGRDARSAPPETGGRCADQRHPIAESSEPYLVLLTGIEEPSGGPNPWDQLRTTTGEYVVAASLGFPDEMRNREEVLSFLLSGADDNSTEGQPCAEVRWMVALINDVLDPGGS